MSKSSTFRVVWTVRFCSNSTGMWYKNIVRNIWRDTSGNIPHNATEYDKTDELFRVKDKILQRHSIMNTFVPYLSGRLGGTIMQLSITGK